MGRGERGGFYHTRRRPAGECPGGAGSVRQSVKFGGFWGVERAGRVRAGGKSPRTLPARPGGAGGDIRQAPCAGVRRGVSAGIHRSKIGAAWGGADADSGHKSADRSGRSRDNPSRTFRPSGRGGAGRMRSIVVYRVSRGDYTAGCAGARARRIRRPSEKLRRASHRSAGAAAGVHSSWPFLRTAPASIFF